MKKFLGKVCFILIGAALGVAMALLMDRFVPGALDLPGLSFAGIWAGALVWMYVVIYLSIPLHEAGHLVCGLLTGYEFVSFRVGKTIWTKRDGKLVRGRCQVAGTGGQCLMTPPGAPDKSFPYALYNLGGALANGLAAVLLWAAALAVNGIPGLMCAIAAVTSLAVALMNLLPFPGVCNDGRNLLDLRKSDEARRAFWITLEANARLSEGMRPRDLPADWTEPLPELTKRTPPLTFGLVILEAARRMDEGAYDETMALLKKLLEYPQVVPAQRLAAQGGLLVLTLLTVGPGAEAGALCTPKLLGALRAGRTSPPSQCALYAAARLQTGNEKDAQRARAALEKALLTHPYPGESELYRELFDAVDHKAQTLCGT